MLYRVLSGLVVFSVAGSCCAQLPDPALTSIFPPGAQRGSEIEVTVAGRDLDEPTELVFSEPGIKGTPKKVVASEFEPEALSPNQFIVRVGHNVPSGLYEARVVGRFGISTPRAFVVQSEPQLLDPGNNNTLATASPLGMDNVVYGRANPNAVDYYRIQLRKGQAVSIQCQANEIDSRLEPLISVLSSTGRFLASSRSARMPRLHFTAPADDNYVVTLNDHIYSGGDEFAYRLMVSSAPYIEFMLPTVGTPGELQDFTLFGTNLPDGTDADFAIDGTRLQQKKVRIFIPPEEEIRMLGPAPSFVCGQRAYGFSLESQGVHSNTLPIGIAKEPVVLEQEPNDRPHPQRVNTPVEFVGTFYPRRDEDWLRFSAKQGDAIQFDVFGHRQGSDMDPALFVWEIAKNADGTEQLNNLNVTDDRGFDRGRFQRAMPRAFDYSDHDPSVRFSAPKDGEYCVSLRDTYGANRSDPRSVYRLVISKPRPNFRLVAWPQRFRNENNTPRVEVASPVVRRGGSVSIPVDVIREGDFAGDIVISLEGLPTGVSCSAATIGPSQSEAALIITAANDAPFSYGNIHIVGKAAIDGGDLTHEASYGVLLSETADVRSIPVRGRATRDMTLAVIAAEIAPALVKIEGGGVFETSRGGVLKIPISYTRAGTIKGDLKLQPIGMPGEVKASELVLKPDAAEGALELTLNNANIPLGTYSFCLVGQTTVSHQRNLDEVVRSEQSQKSFEVVLNQIVESEKESTAKLEAAKKELEQLIEKSKQVADAQAQNEAGQVQATVAAANEAMPAAQKMVTLAEEQVKQLAEKKARADQHRKTLEERVNQAKKQNEPKDVTVSFASTSATLRVAKMPVKMSPGQMQLTAKRSNEAAIEIELPVKVERLFGFSESIELRAEPPTNSPGLEAAAASIAKDQAEVALRLPIKPEAKPGRYAYRLITKLRFGEIDLEDSISIDVNVTE